MAQMKVVLFFLLISGGQAFVDDQGTSKDSVRKDESKVYDVAHNINMMLNDTKISSSEEEKHEEHDARTEDDLFTINRRVGLEKKKFPGAKLEGGDYLLTNGQRLLEILSRYQGISSDMTSLIARHWPKTNGRVKVPYSISRTVQSNSRKMKAITQAIKNFKKNSCIDFEPVSNQNHYLRFISGGGCWSYIGMIETMKPQPISIGDGCWYTGIVEHEILHALGFFHEQSRSDRDKYVRIMLQNLVDKRLAGNFKKNRAEDEITKGLPYDYDSVMHYDSRAFAKRGTYTMVKINGDRIVANRMGLSPLDLKLLNTVYGCKIESKPSCQERCEQMLSIFATAKRVCAKICGGERLK